MGTSSDLHRVIDYTRNCIADILHREPETIDAKDTFESLGFDSLDAIELWCRIDHDWHINTSESDFMMCTSKFGWLQVSNYIYKKVYCK